MVRKSKSSISANRKIVNVVYLDGQSARIETEVDFLLKDVLDKACHNIGITDSGLLGLALHSADGQVNFVDLETKIAKNAPKIWKTAHQGLNQDGEPVLTLHLLVQFYVEKLSSVRDPQMKSYYYQQLKKNFIEYPIMYPDDRCFLLAAYSMIAEGLDHSSSFDPRSFFPAWVVDKHRSKYIREHLPSLLSDFTNLSALDAQSLVSVSLCHETPISYNMHLYRMSKETQHAKPHSYSPTKHCNSSKHSSTSQARNECLQCTSLYIGIGARGIETFEIGDGGFIHSLSQHRWGQLEKMNVAKRKLELVFSGISTYLVSSSEEQCKSVFRLCQQCHSNHLLRQNHKLRQSLNKSFRSKPGEYRESLIYSADESESELSSPTHHLPEEECKSSSSNIPLIAHHGYPSRITSSDYYKHNRQNRHSIISDAASSTTSGIVSDRTCFSYYDSQEEFLGGYKMINSSQDSLLEPSETPKNLRMVQRATSEPSKNFKQLRELKVKQQMNIVPPPMSRAVSDDTVRSTRHKVGDHIYENISQVRNRLMLAAQAKPNKLSPRVSLDTSLPGLTTQLPYSRHIPAVQSHGALNYSMGNLSQLGSAHNKPAFQSQYSMITPSASMEQLLKDYQPPPSYNEKHKKVREQMIAASKSQEKLSCRATTDTPRPTKAHKSPISHKSPVSQKSMLNLKSTTPSSDIPVCTCRTTSYPEIDKLKDMTGFPMIQALCNDKHLQQLSPSCQHCNNNNNNNSNLTPRVSNATPVVRPFSWHSESFMLPNSLPNGSPNSHCY